MRESLLHFGGLAIMAQDVRFRPVSFAPPPLDGFAIIGGTIRAIRIKQNSRGVNRKLVLIHAIAR